MNKIQILLVEDNEGDIILTTEALDSMRIENEIQVVKTGKDAIDFMNHKGRFACSKLPDLVLLDINLPIKNGFEVLAEIRANEETKCIPVIMLTTSSSFTDQQASFNLKADMFVTKPIDMHKYEKVVESIENFWMNYSESMGRK